MLGPGCHFDVCDSFKLCIVELTRVACSCHWLIMGKNENWHLLLSHTRYFDRLLQKCSLNFYKNVLWVVFYQTYHFCCNLLIWLVTMATKSQDLRKNIQKSTPQKLFWGIKLKPCRIVSININLYRHCGCYGKFKFPLTYNGKSENWDLLLSHCSVLTKYLQKRLIWFHGNRKVKFAGKKINSSEAIRRIKLKLCRINSSLYKNIAVA